MKKMLSLAAMLAVLSYASPASAELKIGGDASVRLRSEFNGGDQVTNNNELKTQYRIRLKGSADLGDGYFFKTLIQNEEYAGSWANMATGNQEKYGLEVSNFYFGRVMEKSHYQIGRLPLNSFNNPIFDLSLYAVPFISPATSTYVTAVDVPVFQYNFDRIFGLNYGTKVGNGDLNATLVIYDNKSTIGADKGLFNDGYALHLDYKTTIGDVTFEPQALISLTDLDGSNPNIKKVSPNSFGANAIIPAGSAKIGLSAFYTVCEDTDPDGLRAKIDYSGYLLRLKGESGPVMAWIDYNRTSVNSPVDVTFNNFFVWAQYNVKVHESALGTFSVAPTIRYRASGIDSVGSTADNSQLRGELYATVTF